MGKTMIVEKFARDHPGYYDAANGLKRIPVVVVQMVSGPDEARFYKRLLAAIGAPEPPRPTLGLLESAALRAGRDDATPSVPDLLAFATAPHRPPSPPELHEQPRLSLEARRANRGFLEFPIARQALLVVVPEYDRVAPPLAKPVRPGLQALANGSLLQNFALAAA